MKIIPTKQNTIRSFYYTEDKTSSISDPLVRVYLSSWYGILGRGQRGKSKSVNNGELAVCWTQKNKKIFAGLYRIEDANFNPTNNVGYATLWGSPTGSQFQTKCKVKELVKPMFIFDSNKLVRGLKTHDNAKDVLQVCEELLKHI